MVAEVAVGQVVGGDLLVNSVKVLLRSGVVFTMKSLVNRVQKDFRLSFHDADALVWNGAGEHWTINQTTGVVSVMSQ